MPVPKRGEFMKNWKRLCGLLSAAALCMSLLAGCGEESGVLSLTVCAGGAPEDLDPIYAASASDQTILEHLYENLMRVTTDVSGDVTVTNGMAKSVDQEENHDGTVTYTFRLRSAKWSDGRAVKADDFVYAWQRLADPANASPYASILSMVAGYDTVRATGDVTALQVTAKNDSTLEVVLDGHYDWFLPQVCTSPATMPVRRDILEKWKADHPPAEPEAETEDETAEPAPAQPAEPWWSDVEKLVTNGPYQVAAAAGEGLTLAVREDYSGSHVGPTKLTFRYAASREEAWTLYENKEVDFVWALPEEQLALEAEDETWSPAPELATTTVLFNCAAEPFTDPLIRRALGLAVDREALAEALGVTARPAEGLIPPGISDGDDDFRTDSVLLDNDPEQYDIRCGQARDLLDQAGWDSGADLGILEYIYVDSADGAAVAQLLAEQWRGVLGVEVALRPVTAEELSAALRSGEYTMAAADLQAVAADAECFLSVWESGSSENVIAYENSAYDTLISIIARADDGTARMGCLHDAEELLLADMPLVPLYTRVADWELRGTYTGVCRDSRGWFSFLNVAPWTA